MHGETNKPILCPFSTWMLDVQWMCWLIKSSILPQLCLHISLVYSRLCHNFFLKNGGWSTLWLQGNTIVCTVQYLHHRRKLIVVIFVWCNYCTTKKSRDMDTTFEWCYPAYNSCHQYDRTNHVNLWLPTHDAINSGICIAQTGIITFLNRHIIIDNVTVHIF